MRVAVVHDWLYTIGGAERVLKSILQCFPDAVVHTLIDTLDLESRRRLGYETSRTSFLQSMPFACRHHRMFLPLMPLAIEQIDLSGFDLVISSSYAVAKGVITGPDQLHVSYVHSPMRYAWDMQAQYLRDGGLDRGVRGWLAKVLMHQMRMWDVRTASGVDHYITNSRFVARRIRKIYGRPAVVIHPPVSVPEVPPAAKPTQDDAGLGKGYFLTASRLVRYKNVAAIVEAFAALPEHQLVVAGGGPEFERLRAQAGPNVRLTGFVDDDVLTELMAGAQAFVFAAEEDFGIAPVEAQGLGTPVIALGRGGTLETVIAEGKDPTGMFFDTPCPDDIASAIRRFVRTRANFSSSACHANARRFATARFEAEFSRFVLDAYDRFDHERRWRTATQSDHVIAKLQPEVAIL